MGPTTCAANGTASQAASGGRDPEPRSIRPGGSIHPGRALTDKLRSEAPPPDDGIFTEPGPHRVECLVDPVLVTGDAAEQVALRRLRGLDKVVGTDPDLAERAPVGLAGAEHSVNYKGAVC